MFIPMTEMASIAFASRRDLSDELNWMQPASDG